MTSFRGTEDDKLLCRGVGVLQPADNASMSARGRMYECTFMFFSGTTIRMTVFLKARLQKILVHPLVGFLDPSCRSASSALYLGAGR